MKKIEAERLLKKFNFQLTGTTHHRKWVLYYEGTRILSTYYSKGRGDMKTTAENKFRAQLRLNQQQLRDAISCKLEFEHYIEMLQQKGMIP